MKLPGRTHSRYIAAVALSGTFLAVVALLLPDSKDATTPETSTTKSTAATAIERSRGAWHPLAGRFGDVPEYVENEVVSSPERAWRCRAEDLPQFGVFVDDGNAARMSGYATSLTASRNAEHVLAAAMLSDAYGKGAADELLESALALDPTNPHVLWWAADLCARKRQPASCRDPETRSRIHMANRDNGAYWATLANQQLRNGDRRRAIESLRRASTAAALDYGFAQQVLLLERGLSAVSDLGYGQRFTLALAAAPLMGNHSELYTACRELVTSDAAWAQACLEFGRRAAADSKTIIFKMIGYGIQRNVLGETGNADQLQAINEAQEALRRSLRDYADDWHLLMLADPRFIAQYADHFAVHGEFAATGFARDEITRLRSLPGYDPCALAEAGDLPGNVK